MRHGAGLGVGDRERETRRGAKSQRGGQRTTKWDREPRKRIRSYDPWKLGAGSRRQWRGAEGCGGWRGRGRGQTHGVGVQKEGLPGIAGVEGRIGAGM